MTLPLIIRGDTPDLASWLRVYGRELDGALDRHGAIVFRGFLMPAIQAFEQAAQLLCPDLDDGYGDLPREAEGDHVYQATPYPARYPIRLHNEASHTRSWPTRIMFFCMTPAARGGETLLADGREVLRRLPPALVATFEQRGLTYVRNFVPGFDVAWQDFFKTGDADRVSRWLADRDVGARWTDTGLRTRWPATAVARHHRTGEPVWFNQLQLHHVACLPPAPRAALVRLFAADDLPRHVTYGDGGAIDDATIAAITDAMDAATVRIALEPGDLLLVDNLLVSHGRAPYSGVRRIAVAMGAMASR
jgi:alpha-ketoglutarate-dependent taurine dioxygenase